MSMLSANSSVTVFSALALMFVVPEQSFVNVSLGGAANEFLAPRPPEREVVVLKDFRDQEIRVAGFTLTKEMTVHIYALGGGDKSSWRGFTDDDDMQMYAAGWIIDAETREPVWEMTFHNTSGRADKRRFDNDIKLSRGSYEVYFAAHGYDHRSNFSNFSMNIDRRTGRKRSSGIGEGLLKMFGLGSEDWYEDFMKLAKDWGITISVPDGEAGSVTRFEAPLENHKAIFTAYNLGDREYLKKAITAQKDLTVRLTATGEGRRQEGLFDYGWIVRSDTRERVWEMTWGNTDYAGGSVKNREFSGDVKLSKGSYELYFVTDDSHSPEDWNAKPPFDPYRYGIAITVNQEADKNALTISEPEPIEKDVIVSLTRVRDDDFVNAGFSLKQETTIRIYALGEQVDRDDPADYGWITNAKTRERVWSMERRRMHHAGGAQKNKMIDELITLPKGDYIVYYQTDGSHAYNDWNSDAPFDEEHWGITIMGVGEKFDPKSVESFKEEDEANVIAQIIKARDNEHRTKRFSISQPAEVRIYAIGEGQDREMSDYGWIEDVKSGRIVWEMTYRMTEHAGGAKKNRLVSATITLQPGEYELHYETDGSHAFNDWNDTAPEDRMHWGITVYKEK